MIAVGFRQRLDNVYGQYFRQTYESNLQKSEFAESMKRGADLVPMYSLQSLVRPLFGKGQEQPPDIGDHPDFLHLKGTHQLEYCPITTLFMDIESSTRLSLLYPLEAVYQIKNSFIRATMEIIKAFDGHVHRVMGDAVMAFFGGKRCLPEDGIINGLNCAAVLRYFVEAVVIPRLAAEGYEDPFGIRLGLDYGDRQNVLWSSYGYPGMDEVTATSYYVDVASKLQHAAGRNEIMIGQSLREAIDFPQELLSLKSEMRDGHRYELRYVEPNHTDRNGNPINYRQFVLNWKDYLLTTPVASVDSDLLKAGSSNLSVKAEVYTQYKGQDLESVYPGSSFILSKERGIKFIPKLTYLPMLPYTLKFMVENHGVEAKDGAMAQGRSDSDNHVSEYTVKSQSMHNSIYQWEHTQYRGLHFMTVEIHTHRGLTEKARLGVYVQ